MSSGSYIQTDVRCPYYSSDNGKNTICCEGIIPNSTLKNFFISYNCYAAQLRTFCCGCYWNCEICSMLDSKYED